MRLRAAFLGLILLAGCASPNDELGEGTGFTSGDGTWSIIPAAERQSAPELSGRTLEDKEISTTDFAGRVVVINVWGSWCAPCRAEAPDLVAAHQELGDEVEFLGVNTRDLDPAPALAFQRAFEVSYPSLYDPNGELLLAFGQLPPKAIPSTVVLDAEGRLAARVIGVVSTSTLTSIIDDVQADT